MLPRIYFVMGSGGVGKSTYSAALAAKIAKEQPSERVLLITIDPARRLASSMGITAQGNDIVEVALPSGAVFAVSMLDAADAWDSLIRRIAPDEATAERVLSNGLYRNITGRFVNSHDYIAIERLWELAQSQAFDAIVVDTPPSRNALSVLDASERMRDFFASRLLRWLTIPATNRVVAVTSKPFFALADRVLGARFLQDISEFFALFRTMEPAFTSHAGDVQQMLHSEATTFVVVTTSSPAPAAEAEFLADALRERGLRLGSMVLNRAVDPAVVDEASEARSSDLSPALMGLVRSVLNDVGREESVMKSLADRHTVRVERITEARSPVTDVAGVAGLAESIAMP